jgi:GH15 family glucan-1,4-alpha-glucosidase
VPYAAIDSYGLIGNMRTAALVGRDGSIDWLCLPHFDSPSVFAAILDDAKGGRFAIRANGKEVRTEQYYLPDTNVLTTRIRTQGGLGEIIDFMPVCITGHDAWEATPNLVRIVRVEHGRLEFTMECSPAFDYARRRTTCELMESGAMLEVEGSALELLSTVELRRHSSSAAGRAGGRAGGRVGGRGGGRAFCTLSLREGETAAFALRWRSPEGRSSSNPRSIWGAEEANGLMRDTVRYWREWIAHCTYCGRWREAVHRSALVLKLLTFEPTGAIVAAPTCSLPERIGGARNWDYRYTWLRDAAFTVYALLHIGYSEEAARFADWLQQRSHELEEGRLLRPVYGIDGRHELPEEELTHLDGYCGSRPVRIGNGAYDQLQLDIAGALIDAVYVYDRDGVPISHDMWVEIRRMLDWVCEHWQRKDHGVWEVRGRMHDFVYSRLMCWVALDRGLRLSVKRALPGDIKRWRAQRDAIYDEIIERGWRDSAGGGGGAFVQRYGSDDLDAANLMMPLVSFISPSDPMMLRTLEAIQRPLAKRDRGSGRSPGLMADFVVHRYNTDTVDDGVGGSEGGFNMCSFWLVEALSRAGRSDRRCIDRARLLFERLISHASPTGLFAEQFGDHNEALGNYPQGLTHLSLIIAAYHLDRTLDGHGV